ncbi:GNAT family N-acetyltransferase [Kineococcus rhizosphaerae]|uniref:RimJ/RimL family protein N-acetyltransferase n=1 Tax=Kineococcus rhizosphaerae TaxID=559628 RepID=A0A2T0QXQ5_9ACTN|nr:GNAT family protein [Kineococcus rhizosphaerae]PRY10817.1 RimJ/RimL family protein N-acetyltransferase [Kineococcus rhizosphaerae]
MIPVELHPFAALRAVVAHPDGDVELRAGDLDGVLELARVAARGVHGPGEHPFSTPWTDCDPAERARRTFRWQLGGWSSWTPQDWRLDLVVRRGGTVVGTQSLEARHFRELREVVTGSWLGLEHQGRGTGGLMRAAALHLAFAGLGATSARSDAFVDNPRSLGVSRRLGYVDDGVSRVLRDGVPAVQQRLRLDAAGWTARERPAVHLEGVEPVLAALT